VVGISAVTTNNEAKYVIEELWEVFKKEVISDVIPNIIDDKVYLVYTDYTQGEVDSFRVTIGYKTGSITDVYEGLTGVNVLPAKYAVFEVENEPLSSLDSMWTKASLSDLQMKNDHNFEIYHFNTNGTIKKVDLMLSIPFLESEFETVSEKEVFNKNEIKPQKVEAIKLNKSYTIKKVNVVNSDTIQSPEFDYVAIEQDSFYISGLQTTVNLKEGKILAQKIEELWNDFYKKNYARSITGIINTLKVYVVYHGYTENTMQVIIGYKTTSLETISKQALKDQKKSFVKPDKIKEYVTKIKRYGITVSSDFLFGFDAHDEDIFEETIDFINDSEMDEVYPHLVIPFPGSETFERLESENRLLTKDWSQYDGNHTVYQPKLMSPKTLEEGTYWVWDATKKDKTFLERIFGWSLN
jgi:predicted transcriptional regulator YdeE